MLHPLRLRRTRLQYRRYWKRHPRNKRKLSAALGTAIGLPFGQYRGGYGGGGSSDIAWEFDASTGSIVPSRGTGTASFTRATTATVLDHEGIVRDALSGEVRLDGMRRVENLVRRYTDGAPVSTEDLSGWVQTNATLTAGQTDPLGGTKATRVTATGASAQVYITANMTTVASQEFRSAIWLRRVSGTGTVNLQTPSNGSTAVTLTASWQRFAVAAAAAGGRPYCGITIVTSGDVVEMAFPLLEEVTSQSNQNPSDYVSVGVLSAPYHGVNVDGVKYFATTNGNTVASNVVTEAAGTALTNLGYLPEPASTNLVLQSENFGTTWVAVGTPTRSAAAKRVGRVVLDLIGDDSAIAVEGYLQTVPFTGNAAKAFSFFISKGTATDSLIRIRDTTAGADRWSGVVTWTGSVPTVTLSAGTLEGIDALANDIYRVRGVSTSVTAANTNSIQVFPASDAAASVLLTGDIYVGGVQAENDTACSSYIPTTTATVTRNADVLSYATSGIAGFNAAAWTLYAEAYGPATPTVHVLGLSDGTTNERAQLAGDGTPLLQFFVGDGGAAQANMTVAGAMNSRTTLYKLAGSCAANDFQVARDGSAPTTDTSGTMPTVTTLSVGNIGSAATNHWRNRIKKARLYNVAKGAEVQGLTA